MTLSSYDLLDGYGSAVETGNAALFVGAGLSTEAGYPLWDELLADARIEAEIPQKLTDLPLVAEYYERGVSGGRDRLEDYILSKLAKIEAAPGLGHSHIASLPITEVWTSNLDSLLEEAIPDAQVVRKDEDLAQRRTSWKVRVIKMHGSLTQSRPVQWAARPVITRGDYETYERSHPRLWAALKATFLTRSFLFLGFSFADPNIEVLLRLARTEVRSEAPEHYTVLRRPKDPDDVKLHEHHVRDLEESGIGVWEVDSYQELEPLLKQLIRRTTNVRLFVSGSKPEEHDILALSRAFGNGLADIDELEVASLAGEAAMAVTYALGHALRAKGDYRAHRLQLHFRKRDDRPPALDERIGTAIYSDLEQAELRESVLHGCRAAVIIGGGDTTAEEVEVARNLEVPIMPLGVSGGTARRIWAEMSGGVGSLAYGGRPVDQNDFALLENPDPLLAAAAAVRLVKQAMYLDS
jgi:hypothetical protein